MLTLFHRLAALLLLAALLAACGSTPAASAPSEPAASTAAMTEAAEPSEVASASAEPSESPSASEDSDLVLAVPLEAPCHAIDTATVARLMGGAIEESREWVPGDQPFGDRVPPSGNFGCQYVGERAADGAPANEFGLTIVGRELTAAEWQDVEARFGECNSIDTASEIADLAATACVGAPGYTNVGLLGLLGSTGLSCMVYRPDGEIDAALQAEVVQECVRIVLELAGSSG